MATAEDIWLGDWQSKIQERVRSVGCSTVSEFLHRHQNIAYFQVARLLGPDVAAVQLAMMQFAEAKRDHKVRTAAMDALCRALHVNLKHGWNKGLHAKRMMAGSISEWLAVIEFRGLAPELRTLGEAVWAALKLSNPRIGWLPNGPDDGYIKAAFDKGWPIDACRKIPRQSYGLLCPKCTAVLITPTDNTSFIDCPHCGEQIELV